MTPYAHSRFDRQHHNCYRDAVAVLDRLPVVEGYSPMRCHEITRAIADVLNERHKNNPVHEVFDGKYGAVDHTWMVLTRAPMPILDVYAVGRLPQVALVDRSLGLADLYHEGSTRYDINWKQVVGMADEMRQILKAHRAMEVGGV